MKIGKGRAVVSNDDVQTTQPLGHGARHQVRLVVLKGMTSPTRSASRQYHLETHPLTDALWADGNSCRKSSKLHDGIFRLGERIIPFYEAAVNLPRRGIAQAKLADGIILPGGPLKEPPQPYACPPHLLLTRKSAKSSNAPTATCRAKTSLLGVIQSSTLTTLSIIVAMRTIPPRATVATQYDRSKAKACGTRRKKANTITVGASPSNRVYQSD